MGVSTLDRNLLAAATHGYPEEERLPLTRASALRLFRNGTLVLLPVQIASFASTLLAPAPASVIGDGLTDWRIHAVLGVILLPLLSLALTGHAEVHHLGRPPKPLLAASFVFWVAGSVLLAGLSFGLAAGSVPASSGPLLLMGHVLMALSPLLMAVWFVGTLLVECVEDPTD